MEPEAVFKAIDGQAWIESLSSAAQDAIHKVYGALGPAGAEVKDLLHGVWLRHPLHPVLTDVPVGAWSVELALDALESITVNRELRSGADAAVGIGVLGAIGSAVTGLTDFAETDDRAKKTAAVHGALNLVATGLYASSWFMRRGRGRRNAAVGLSMLGFLIAGSASWLGGHLVFGEQVGVDHTAGAERGKPDRFTRVMKDDDLGERKLTRVEADGVGVLLVRIDGKIHALRETCSHLGGPLAEGKLEGNAVVCPWHGSTFALEDGEVERGPSCYRQPRFEVRVRQGDIEVRAEKDKTPKRTA